MMCIRYLVLSLALMVPESLRAQSEIHQGYSETADQYEVDGRIVSNVDVTAPLWNPRGKTV